MKQVLLLVMLLILCGALLNVTNIYATTENSQTPYNNLNTNTIFNNTTNTSSNENIQNTTGTVEGNITEPVNDSTVKNQLLTHNTPNSNDAGRISLNNSNITNVQNSIYAAGDELYENVRGIWLNTADVNSLNVDELKEANITDIFVKCNIYSSPTYQNILKSVVAMFNRTGIRIHAWITCFKDADGKWVDPQGKYSYEVQVPYTEVVRVPYKAWYRGWYSRAYTVRVRERYRIRFFSRGEWRVRWATRWTHRTRYRRTYGWTYRWDYKDEYQTKYRQETRYGYDKTHTNQLISFISNVTKEYSRYIHGIHLDYVRYSGVGDNAAYKHSGGTETITEFVKDVHKSVKAINSSVKLSAALMPEGRENAKHYGQDYGQLSQYLDFLVPMIYKGNYGYNSSTGTNSKNSGTDWIGNVTAYIVQQANGTPVVAGLQTYRSDNNLTLIPAGELQNDITAALRNGASGYTLFKYGLIDDDYFKNSNDTSVTFTLSQIQNAAANVKSFIETYGKLPNYVTVGKNQIMMSDMLNLMITGVLQLNSGITTPVTLKDIDSPTNSTGNLTNGTINKAEYLNIAQKIKSFIDSNGIAPNHITSFLGNIQYESIIYMYSKILNFYNTNNRLPNHVTVTAWITNSVTNGRPVYITSDNINNAITDMNRINKIVNGLRALGLTAVNWGLGPNTHYSVLENNSVPVNALIANIYGGADAGVIYEMGQSYYKKLVGARKVFSVWIPPATDITGLAWLPRAHDDNYSSANFTGIANPDQYLLNNGYYYIYSGDLNTIISRIYKEATTA